MKHFAIVFLLIVISGCAATGPSFSERRNDMESTVKDKARLVFFRTKDTHLYSARKASVEIDNKKTGNCAFGGFFYRDLPEGKHIIKTELWDMPGKCEVVVNVKAGAIYYFRIDSRSESFAPMILAGAIGNAIESNNKSCGGAFKIYPQNESKAKNMMASLKLSD